MEPKKGNYQICLCLRVYACVEGALASVMLMLIHVLIVITSLNFDDQP